MLQFIRKIDEFVWHCPHACAHVSASDDYPKAFRYSSTLVAPVPVAALSVTIAKTGGSIMFHRMWGNDLQPCDLVGACSVAKAIKTGSGEATIPLRAIGPWHGRNKAATFANLKAAGDPAFAFMKANAQSGSRAQPESFWQALQTMLIANAAPFLAQGGHGP
jgi:hypothetical protein